MAKCSDCIHSDVCRNATIPNPEYKGVTEDKSKICIHFKNKADIVEVVRCPECVYCEKMKCTELRDNSGHPLDVATFDYCSQGEKKQKNDFKE